MIRKTIRQPAESHAALVPLTLAAIALLLSANTANAQQTSPVEGSPPADVLAPADAAAPPASVQPLGQMSGCRESRCGHLIDLLIRNRLREQAGALGAEVAPGLVLSAPPSFPQPGDLELLNVCLVTAGTPAVGPVILVEVRNHSLVDVGGFQISVAGVLGQIHNHCPTITGTVEHLPAGSVSQFQIQLPASVMRMGLSGQQFVPFDTIIVAIDSFDELMEASELNNVRIIRRVDLLPVPVAVVTEVGPPATAPVRPEVPTVVPPADSSTPSPDQSASPLDSFLLEDNRLETTRPADT